MTIVDDNALKTGTILLKKYKIIKLLGKGGFSFVYLVKEKNDRNKYFVIKEFFPHDFVTRKQNNEVILKNLLINVKKDELSNLKKLFKNEANTLKKIATKEHSGVINFISFHKNINNTLYIITDYIKTSPLQDNFITLLSPKLLDIFLNNILTTIEHIHHCNIYHQDIKMENILIQKDFTPLVIDFGASTILYDKKLGKYINTTSSDSAAVEQLSLNYPPEINESTDIYSIAAVIYKILIGKYPINSKVRELYVEEGKADPFVPLNSKVLPFFNKHTLQCINKALSLYQEDRYSNIKEFKKALSKKNIYSRVKYLLKI